MVLVFVLVMVYVHIVFRNCILCISICICMWNMHYIDFREPSANRPPSEVRFLWPHNKMLLFPEEVPQNKNNKDFGVLGSGGLKNPKSLFFGFLVPLQENARLWWKMLPLPEEAQKNKKKRFWSLGEAGA